MPCRWTELTASVPSAAASGGAPLGLHCYGLSVSAVAVNGAAVPFEIQPPARCAQLQRCLLLFIGVATAPHYYSSPAACCRCREELPESVAAAAAAGGAPERQAAAVAEGAFFLYERQLQRERQPELTFRQPPAAGSQTSPGAAGGKREELRIRVEFAGSAASGGGGLRFHEGYAATDAQLRRTSAWLPCVDSPAAAVRWEGVDLTCGADEVG